LRARWNRRVGRRTSCRGTCDRRRVSLALASVSSRHIRVSAQVQGGDDRGPSPIVAAERRRAERPTAASVRNLALLLLAQGRPVRSKHKKRGGERHRSLGTVSAARPATAAHGWVSPRGQDETRGGARLRQALLSMTASTRGPMDCGWAGRLLRWLPRSHLTTGYPRRPDLTRRGVPRGWSHQIAGGARLLR
jgi:hypothetical protein